MRAVPREHGAWAVLLAALVLAWAHPWVRGWPAAAVTLLFTAGFAAQEPLRAVAEGRRAAWAWLALYAALLAAGTATLVLAGGAHVLLPAAAAGGLLTAADLGLRRRGAHRSFLLRLLGMAGLTLALPSLLLVVHPGRGGYAFALWALTFLYAATRLLAVRARNDARRAGGGGAWRRASLLGQAGLYAAVLLLVGARLAPAPVLLAFVPGTVAALAPPSGAGLRAVGWREVAHLGWFVAAVLLAYHG